MKTFGYVGLRFFAAAGLLFGSALVAQEMSFFVTSSGPGDGGNLGGLAGADAHCQALADAAGHGDTVWRAYLSTQGPGAVHARDRIGSGLKVKSPALRPENFIEGLFSDKNRLFTQGCADNTSLFKRDSPQPIRMDRELPGFSTGGKKLQEIR